MNGRAVDCRHPRCGAKVVFVMTRKGHQMPVDLATCKCAACGHPYSAHVPNTASVSGGPCADFRLAQLFDSQLMTSHFGTCVEAARFRRRAARGVDA